MQMNKFENINYLAVILRWKKSLGLVFIIAAILSVVFTGTKFIKPLYKSTALVYPVNIFSYSEESETEQMLQILGSDDMKRTVIDSLDLFRHYKIDRDEPYAYEKVIRKFDKRVSIKRTQYESVKIEALDRSPKVAFYIVNEILEAYNVITLQLMKKKAEEVLLIKETLFRQKNQEVDSLRILVDTLINQSNLAEYNILKESMRGSFQYLQNGNNASETMETMSEKSLELFFNQRLLESELVVLIELKKEYELALSDVNKHLEFTDVISAPVVAQKKSYPIRWLIVILSMAATMFCAFIVILIIDKNQQKIQNES